MWIRFGGWSDDDIGDVCQQQSIHTPSIPKDSDSQSATFSTEFLTHLEYQLEKETAAADPYHQNVENTRRPSRKRKIPQKGSSEHVFPSQDLHHLLL